MVYGLWYMVHNIWYMVLRDPEASEVVESRGRSK